MIRPLLAEFLSRWQIEGICNVAMVAFIVGALSIWALDRFVL